MWETRGVRSVPGANTGARTYMFVGVWVYRTSGVGNNWETRAMSVREIRACAGTSGCAQDTSGVLCHILGF